MTSTAPAAQRGARQSSGDQASRLRALFGSAAPVPVPCPDDAVPEPVAPARVARLVAVASGKGGVGKTSLAVNLALCLGARGCPATLLDADLGLGNAEMLLGLAPGLHLGHVLEGSRAIHDVLTPVAPGCWLVPGASGLAHLADLDRRLLGRLLDALWAIDARGGAIVADCGAGIGAGVLALARSADLTLVVVTPEPTSIADAYALMKCVLRPRGPGVAAGRVGVVVNHVSGAAQAQDIHARLEATCARFLGSSPAMIGWIPTDESVGRAIVARRALVHDAPKSPAARAIEALSASVAALVVPSSPPIKARTNWLARLLGATGAREVRVRHPRN